MKPDERDLMERGHVFNERGECIGCGQTNLSFQYTVTPFCVGFLTEFNITNPCDIKHIEILDSYLNSGECGHSVTLIVFLRFHEKQEILAGMKIAVHGQQLGFHTQRNFYIAVQQAENKGIPHEWEIKGTLLPIVEEEESNDE